MAPRRRVGNRERPRPFRRLVDFQITAQVRECRNQGASAAAFRQIDVDDRLELAASRDCPWSPQAALEVAWLLTRTAANGRRYEFELPANSGRMTNPPTAAVRRHHLFEAAIQRLTVTGCRSQAGGKIRRVRHFLVVLASAVLLS